MATIRPSTDLRNHYNDISQFCKENNEPVFITENGHGDLAVMSMELYRQLTGREELYRLLDEGLEDVKNGHIEPFEDVMSDTRKRIAGHGVIRSIPVKNYLIFYLIDDATKTVNVLRVLYSRRDWTNLL